MISAALKNLVEAIKLSPRYLLPICIFTGFVVFAPPTWLSIFGITGMVSSYRPWFGLAFLLSGALLVSSAFIAFYERLKERRLGKTIRKYQRHRLHHLTEGEKELLRGFIYNQTRTKYLSMSDGRVGQFESEQIIFRSSSLGQYPDAFAYNIQPWAWDYLNEPPSCSTLASLLRAARMASKGLVAPSRRRFPPRLKECYLQALCACLDKHYSRRSSWARSLRFPSGGSVALPPEGVEQPAVLDCDLQVASGRQLEEHPVGLLT